MAQVNIRIDDTLKEQGEELFNALGLNFSAAVNAFISQSVRQGGIPFKIATETVSLQPKEKDLLVRVFSFYYKNHIWTKMVAEDNSKASDEDYEVRGLANKLGFRGDFPPEIQSRW